MAPPSAPQSPIIPSELDDAVSEFERTGFILAHAIAGNATDRFRGQLPRDTAGPSDAHRDAAKRLAGLLEPHDRGLATDVLSWPNGPVAGLYDRLNALRPRLEVAAVPHARTQQGEGGEPKRKRGRPKRLSQDDHARIERWNRAKANGVRLKDFEKNPGEGKGSVAASQARIRTARNRDQGRTK